MSGANEGWGYKTLAISSFPDGKLFWKFGPNTSKDTEYGDMTSSKFYILNDNKLGIQVAYLKNGSYQINQI